MSNSSVERAKKKYLKEKKIILEGFCIDVTEDIIDDISDLYPDDVAVDKYTRKLIFERLAEEGD